MLLCVIFLGISATKLLDRIIHQCVCKDRTGHVKVLDFKSSRQMANKYYMVLSVKVK